MLATPPSSDLGAPEVSRGSMGGAGGTKHCHFLVNQQLETLLRPRCLSPGRSFTAELWVYFLECPGTEQRWPPPAPHCLGWSMQHRDQ